MMSHVFFSFVIEFDLFLFNSKVYFSRYIKLIIMATEKTNVIFVVGEPGSGM
jgi:hypothetical protein